MQIVVGTPGTTVQDPEFPFFGFLVRNNGPKLSRLRDHLTETWKPGDIVIEQKINEFFGDAESTGFGTGWWSGILSAFFGFLSFGGVLCLHFPQLLSSPELRPHYPMHTMRVLIQCLIVGAILFGVISSILRKKKILALTGMLLAIAATALGGSSVPINRDPARWARHRP